MGKVKEGLKQGGENVKRKEAEAEVEMKGKTIEAFPTILQVSFLPVS